MEDVSPRYAFRLESGRVLKNITDLEQSLRTMATSVYKKHVTNERNDFSNWVGNVYEDSVLASRLKGAKTPKKAAKLVRTRIKELSPRMQTKVIKETPRTKKHMVAKKGKTAKLPKRDTAKKLTLRTIPDAHKFVDRMIREEAMEAPRTDTSVFLRSAAIDFGFGLLVGILIGIIIAKIL